MIVGLEFKNRLGLWVVHKEEDLQLALPGQVNDLLADLCLLGVISDSADVFVLDVLLMLQSSHLYITICLNLQIK